MKTKRTIYLACSTLLGVILSLLVHAGVEFIYLNWARDAGQAVIWHSGCALPWVVQIGLIIAGIVGGFVLGRIWWRKVYIENAGRGLIKKF
ncbi:hypothetical protein ACFLY5_01160 [Patescibacteria group bacterium]